MNKTDLEKIVLTVWERKDFLYLSTKEKTIKNYADILKREYYYELNLTDRTKIYGVKNNKPHNQ